MEIRYTNHIGPGRVGKFDTIHVRENESCDIKLESRLVHFISYLQMNLSYLKDNNPSTSVIDRSPLC